MGCGTNKALRMDGFSFRCKRLMYNCTSNLKVTYISAEQMWGKEIRDRNLTLRFFKDFYSLASPFVLLCLPNVEKKRKNKTEIHLSRFYFPLGYFWTFPHRICAELTLKCSGIKMKTNTTASHHKENALGFFFQWFWMEFTISVKSQFTHDLP